MILTHDIDTSLDLRSARANFEKAYMQQVVDSCQGNITLAATHAGMAREAFHRKAKELGVVVTRPSSE